MKIEKNRSAVQNQNHVFPASISKEEVNRLPLASYKGPIHLIRRDKDLPAAARALSNETLAGFDLETRPAFRKGQSYPPALIQMAGAEAVYLFQIQRLRKPEPLISLLASPDILKAGVAVQDDMRKLTEWRPFFPAGFAEISEITQKAGIVNTGLRNLAAIFLKIRITKRPQVSNWSLPNLSRAQLRYAATDAWVSRLLYEKVSGLEFQASLSSETRPKKANAKRHKSK